MMRKCNEKKTDHSPVDSDGQASMRDYTSAEMLNFKVIISLARCIQNINKRELPVLQEANVTLPQFAVLELIFHKGPQRVCDIVEKTLSTGGNTTVVIDNLEKSGLVKRTENPEDRRAKLVVLTEDGARLIRDLFPRHRENLNRILSVLSTSEKKQLTALAKKLGKNIGD